MDDDASQALAYQCELENEARELEEMYGDFFEKINEDIYV